MDVIGEAADGIEAVKQAKKLHPNVILIDFVVPKMDGITATQQILATQPQVRIIALTSFVAEGKDLPVINAGAADIYSKMQNLRI